VGFGFGLGRDVGLGAGVCCSPAGVEPCGVDAGSCVAGTVREMNWEAPSRLEDRVLETPVTCERCAVATTA
jgi:hypothetical protein